MLTIEFGTNFFVFSDFAEYYFGDDDTDVSFLIEEIVDPSNTVIAVQYGIQTDALWRGWSYILPTITVFGSDLRFSEDPNNPGVISGTIETMVFSNGNTGTLATLSDMSFSVELFNELISQRLSNQASAPSTFMRALGQEIESLEISYAGQSDEILRYIPVLDFGRGEDDVFVGTPGITEQTLLGGEGLDTLGLSRLEGSSITLNLQEQQVISDDYVISFRDFEQFGLSETSVEVVGSDGDDWVFGAGADDTIFLSAGDDVLRGGWGNDNLSGETGRNQVYGETGDDTIRAVAGSTDYIDGGFGNDTIILDPNGVFGPGFAAMNVGNENYKGTGVKVSVEGHNRFSAVVRGGDDFEDGIVDVLQLSDGDDAFFVDDAFTDYVPDPGGAYGSNGGLPPRILKIEEIRAGSGNDIIDLTSNNSSHSQSYTPISIFGEDGDDVIWGQGNGNTLYGGAGNDTLTGGVNGAVLFGGSGADVFEFTLDGGYGLAQSKVMDFSVADGDRIALYQTSFNNAQVLENGLAVGRFSLGGPTSFDGIRIFITYDANGFTYTDDRYIELRSTDLTSENLLDVIDIF